MLDVSVFVYLVRVRVFGKVFRNICWVIKYKIKDNLLVIGLWLILVVLFVVVRIFGNFVVVLMMVFRDVKIIFEFILIFILIRLRDIKL